MAPRSRFSPLTLFLGAVLLFSTHVLAVTAVLGVDLGTEYIKAALVKPGIPLEIVLTKDSRRKETSAVAFKPPRNGPKARSYPERLYGSDAMALAARFPGDVYPNLKALLGLSTDDAMVKEYAARHPALELVPHKVRGTAAFKSKAFTADEEAWMIEEMLAMELKSIQSNAEAAATVSVRSVVLTVPPFYTSEEKRAVQLAADLAGLKVLSLISDGLAVGLNYATTRQFPNINEGGKPEYHMVFDMGAGSSKATLLKFQSRTVKDVGKYNKTIQEVQVLGTGWDRTLGGDALNSLIVDDMVAQFIESKGAQKVSATAEGVRAHGRAIAKLSKEAERLRHVLSANSNTQASFEGLYEDVDFKYKITRADFEKMAEAHAGRVAEVVGAALKTAQVEMADLTSVILHGGASRTPFVQKGLEAIAGSADKIRTNVNSDESAVFGAGFRAAELSPSFRVKEIRITEGPMYPVSMKWTNPKGKVQHQRLWTPISPLGGTAKEITFANHEDFSVNFYQQIGDKEQDAKLLTTKNLTASVVALKETYGCADADISLKASMKLSAGSGEVQVLKASVECEAEVPEKETFVDGVKNLFGFGKNKDEQQPLKDDEASANGSSSTTESSSTTSSTSTESASTGSAATASENASDTSADAADKPKTKKLVVIPVEFKLERTGIPSLSDADLQKAKDRIAAFETSDKNRRLREEALNQLEGYTYKVRDLLENEAFIAASTDKERADLEKKSSEASDWLYGAGVDATKEELKKKLKGLQDIVVPVQKRIEESEKRPELVQGLKDALNQTSIFIDTIRKSLDEYDEWHKSASASASSASVSSAANSASSAAASPAGEFDGLEDDDPAAAAAAAEERTMDDVLREKGPVPPLYTRKDLDDVEALWKTTKDWLAAAEAKQAGLPPTADPALLIKDLTTKREKLDKAGMDLAMKAVRNFESKGKKDAKTKKPAKPKPGSAKLSTTTIPGAEGTPFLKFGDLGKDGKMPTDEEILRMLKEQGVDMSEAELADAKKKAAKEHVKDEL